MADSKEGKHTYGYLTIIDTLGIIKIPSKRWFVLGPKSQFLYYYKTPRDTTPAGKIDVSTAVFLYDRKNPCSMQIKTGNSDIVLEAPDFNARMKWLEALQEKRKNWVASMSSSIIMSGSTTNDQSNSNGNNNNNNNNDQSAGVNNNNAVDDDDGALPDLSRFMSANYSAIDDENNRQQNNFVSSNSSPNFHGKNSADFSEKQPTSIFYLNEKNDQSVKSGVSHDEKGLHDGGSGDRSPVAAVRRKTVHSTPPDYHHRHSQQISNVLSGNAADKVGKVLFKASTSKKSCGNCQEMISVVANLKSRCMDLYDELAANRILVESLRNNLLAAKNQTNVVQRLADFKDVNIETVNYVKECESERTYLHLENASMRKETKEFQEKARKLEIMLIKKNEELEAYKDSLKSKDEMIMKLVEEQSQMANAKNTKILSDDALTDKAIEFENAASEPIVFAELKVNDVTENKLETLKDLLRGYEKQNQFLNKEILELHNVILCLENREQHLARKNFDIEAEYYQLKSRYLLLLNHFQPNKELAPPVVDELLKDAKEALASMNSSKHIDVTDDLGFYLTATGKKAPILEENFVEIAGKFKRVSEELAEKQKKKSSEQYLTWLTKWDSLLVNYTDKTLGPCNELKELVREGIPHTYRNRVWKSVVNWMVKEKIAEGGNGYFECLYKKAAVLNSQDAYDPAMKQIDLDLTRTLPHNKYFEDLQAAKIESLRRVLYAYRWHNPDIGYCQGLNRLAAVALLYLNEEDAFWTLVAIVEHLQPKDYYGNTMLAAQADQRVLRDFVVDKMAKVASHLKSLEVDLSLFTFNWFLTIFVDSFVHSTYLNVWDSFLYEGNKVLFRFALAVIKLNESEILSCKTSSALHSCLSKLGENSISFDKLSQVAFRDMNPFSSKLIDSRRQFHLSQLQTEMDNLNSRRDLTRK